MIKELTSTDLKENIEFFETLSHLSKVIPMSLNESEIILKKINQQDGHVFIYLIENKIISCVTLLIEQKFLRGGALAGHIEDVVTHIGYEKKGYSSALLQHALDYAKQRGCYKVVLYCKPELESFYNKNQFHHAGINMEIRL